ncbi:hypothetical protein ACIHEI_05480 [Kitasatospora sp. NPDC051984]|uniref:hypothetical protein n=1 Tax=Kitasatospora sp. NPDC051984 TaxID=3364059 RepID=UPI0037CBC1EC
MPADPREESRLPILMASAPPSPVISGREADAEDHVVKPFEIAVQVARTGPEPDRP